MLEKPHRPFFSSGPTAKFPGWNIELLSHALLSRSHRSLTGKEKLRSAIEKTRSVLEIPKDYSIGIIPGSATGAIECALWNLLGPLTVDVMAYDVFGMLWLHDIMNELKIPNRALTADFGDLPELVHNSGHDLVLNANGTTSGTYIPNYDWIQDDRQGLVILDATSAAGAITLPWQKLDAICFSWQKGFGGEGGQGMLVLSPKAMTRLESYTPSWPIPRVLRLKYNDAVISGIFRGETINTPSLLCVEDYLIALDWAESIGGIQGLEQRTHHNFSILKKWVEQTPWITWLSNTQENVSLISPCLVITTLEKLPQDEQRNFLRTMANILQQHQVAYDIINHMYAPPSIRLWLGPTIEALDLEKLLPWLEHAYQSVLGDLI